MLVTDKKYLFIGNFDKETNTYTLLPVYDDVQVNDDSYIQKHVEKFSKFNFFKLRKCQESLCIK